MNKTPIVITFTIPAPDQEDRTGIIVARHGELASMDRFEFTNIDALPMVLDSLLNGLFTVEANPPVITEVAVAPPPAPKKENKLAPKPTITKRTPAAVTAPEAAPTAVAVAEPPPAPVEEDPVVSLSLRKGTRIVKQSAIQIEGEYTPADMIQACQLAARLIDGKLWDGKQPIMFTDVAATAKKMKWLTDGDFVLFTLSHFVRIAE